MTFTRREWSLVSLKLSAIPILTSCVSDSEEYSLKEQLAIDADRISSILQRSVVIDLHCDTPIRITREGFDLGQLNDYGQVDIPRMRRGGVTGVFFSIFTTTINQTPKEASKRALEIIAAVKQEVSRHPSDLILAKSTNEIIRAKKENKIAILMGVEGGHMIDSNIDAVQHFFDLGVRYLTLTHNAHTPWADSSAAPPVSNGLTALGREIVRKMNQLGMMVDVSHTSDKTFYDVLETSSAPIIASHSSCRALANHPRNMSDEMLRALAEKDGVVHINYYNSFLDNAFNVSEHKLDDLASKRRKIRQLYTANPKQREAELRKINREQLTRIGRPPLSRLVDHFEHAAQIAGVEHVGLGSDFDGVRDQLPENMEDISKIPNLVSGLLGRGFTESEVQLILGGNTLRAMQRIEQISD